MRQPSTCHFEVRRPPSAVASRGASASALAVGSKEIRRLIAMMGTSAAAADAAIMMCVSSCPCCMYFQSDIQTGQDWNRASVVMIITSLYKCMRIRQSDLIAVVAATPILVREKSIFSSQRFELRCGMA